MVLFCMKYLKKYKNRFVLYLFLSLIIGIFGIFIPVISGHIVDLLIIENNIDIIILYIIIFTVIQLICIALKFINNKNFLCLQTNSAFYLILDLVKHIQNIPISISDTLDKEYLNQRVNNDSNSIIAFTINLLSEFIINLFSLTTSILILFVINIKVCVIMCFFGLLYLITYLMLKKFVYNKSLLLKEEKAKFFSVMLEQLSLLKFINIHGLLEDFQIRFINSYDLYFKNILNVQTFFYLFSSIDNIFSIIANIIIFFWCGILVVKKQMTIGEFTIILSYFNIIIGCFKYFSSIGRSYQDNKVAFNRIKDLLNIKKMSNGIYILDDINSINCKALTFKRNETIIIDHFDYSFLKGNSYCICGENGKGKSTLIELIVGLHQEEYDGVIKINNISTDEIDIISVRKRLVSVMEQDINILKGSLEENINLNENYNLNYDFLQENDDLFTFVKNRDEIFNTGISGGEKLKIGLLRTFSKNAKLYILDEPTSALDSRGAKHVSQIIKKFKNDAIIIVISHDPQIINSCDYIIKL